jgi:hypothetical protein
VNLIRCSDQGGSLEDFFGAPELKNGPAMLELIRLLRAEPFESRVFGLTTHDRLALLAADAFGSSWYVLLGALDEHHYSVEYLMPQATAPWPRAYVRGEARSAADAVRMTLTAMEKSEGWVISDRSARSPSP